MTGITERPKSPHRSVKTANIAPKTCSIHPHDLPKSLLKRTEVSGNERRSAKIAVIPILSILFIDVKTPPPRRPHDHPPNRVRVRKSTLCQTRTHESITAAARVEHSIKSTVRQRRYYPVVHGQPVRTKIAYPLPPGPASGQHLTGVVATEPAPAHTLGVR